MLNIFDVIIFGYVIIIDKIQYKSINFYDKKCNKLFTLV